MFKIYIHTAPNGKKYVGQTSQPENRRWRNGHGYVSNRHFYRAIQKYGWDNIHHEVVRRCETLKEANEIEADLIAELKSNDPKYGYNISGGGDGKNRVAESTRRLMSKARKGKRTGKSNPNYGRKHTPEERRVMSEKTKGRFVGEKSPLWGKHPSDATRAKMSASRKASKKARACIQALNQSKAKKVRCVETGDVYESARGAARKLGYSQGNISSACRGDHEKAYGFHWEYV